MLPPCCCYTYYVLQTPHTKMQTHRNTQVVPQLDSNAFVNTISDTELDPTSVPAPAGPPVEDTVANSSSKPSTIATPTVPSVEENAANPSSKPSAIAAPGVPSIAEISGQSQQ